MEFKELPMKVQLVVAMMHSVGILESLCEQQGLNQQGFQQVVQESFKAAGIDPTYIGELTASLTDEEQTVLEEFMEGDDDGDDAEYDDNSSPKVH